MDSLLDTPGLDSHLARALLLARRVDYPTLSGALEHVRQERKRRPLTLAAELSSRGVLEREELEATLQALSGAQPPAWRPGSQVAGLEILRLLGSGGMGAVYLAKDLETSAEVAVKTLVLGDDELYARFEREAQAQALVDRHPNIVRVHRAGCAAGRAFLVMDAAPGGDLAERLERGPLSPPEATQLVAALASGLAHAHARGVLHRDLKPANVLFDESGSPQLTDFGLARLLDAEELTRTGEVLGTPAYMAPEQARGATQDARTDVYGLGGVLFAALTGRAPFRGPTLLATLSAVVSDPPPAPRSLNPAVPLGLSELCQRCLAKDPDARFESAEALARALTLPARQRGLGPAKLALALGGVALLTLLAGLGLPPRQAPTKSPQPTPSRVATPKRDFPAEYEATKDPAEQAEILEAALAADREDRWARRLASRPLWKQAIPSLRLLHALGHDRVAVGVETPQHKHLSPLIETTLVLSARDGSTLGRLNGAVVAVSPTGSRFALVSGDTLSLVEAADLELLQSCQVQAGVRAVFLTPSRLLIAALDPAGAELLSVLELGSELRSLGALEAGTRSMLRLSNETFALTAGHRLRGSMSLSIVHFETGPLWTTDPIVGLPRGIVLGPDHEEFCLGTSGGKVLFFSAHPTSATGGATGELVDESLADTRNVRTFGPRAHTRAVDYLAWPRRDVLFSLQPGQPGKPLLKIWRRDSSWATLPEQTEPEGWRMKLSPCRRRLFFLSDAGLSHFLVSGFAPELARAEPLFQTLPR